MRRPRPRFSLRSLLVAQTLAIICFALWIRAGARQLAIVDRIYEQGGCVAYPFNRRPGAGRPPEWFTHHRRRDYFFRVVGLGYTSPDAEVDLSELPLLTSLDIVTLEGRQFDDASIGYVLGLHSLRTLALDYTSLTDNGLARIATLKRLTHLSVSDTQVTAAGVARLRAALPWCEIYW